MRRYLTLRQVAERLGKTPAWMYKHVRRLIETHGFPQRDAAMGGWDERAITLWQDRRLAPELGGDLVITLPPLTHGTLVPDPSLAVPHEDIDIGAELDRRAQDLFNAA